MAEETVLSFSFANWVSVTLMAAVGFALLGLGLKIWTNKTAGA